MHHKLNNKSKSKSTQKSPKQKNVQSPQSQFCLTNEIESKEIRYDIPTLRELTATFEREIRKPVAFHTSVLMAKSQPKCTVHNNVLTLYCKNDSKTLCANCSY
jgi:hypothetical protein